MLGKASFISFWLASVMSRDGHQGYLLPSILEGNMLIFQIISGTATDGLIYFAFIYLFFFPRNFFEDITDL